jgi:replicative DNA helicase
MNGARRPGKRARANGSDRMPANRKTPAVNESTQPHSIEAEQGVLGSILISPRETISKCVEKISDRHFYVPAHQTIYQVLVELWNNGQAIDLITFTQVLRDRNLLDTVGGAEFVTKLFTFVPCAANVGYYIDIVRDKYVLREIIAAGTETVRKAYEDQADVGDWTS